MSRSCTDRPPTLPEPSRPRSTSHQVFLLSFLPLPMEVTPPRPPKPSNGGSSLTPAASGSPACSTQTKLVSTPAAALVDGSVSSASGARRSRPARAASLRSAGQPGVLPTMTRASWAPIPARPRRRPAGLDELAASLMHTGSRKQSFARLITPTDRDGGRMLFPQSSYFSSSRDTGLFYAQPKTTLKISGLELNAPARRGGRPGLCPQGASSHRRQMMHSQGYDIFDKVNLYDIWRQEFTLEKPRTRTLPPTRHQPQRSPAHQDCRPLDPAVAQEIINADRRPADEVVFFIANRPRGAQGRLRAVWHLTVAAVRKLDKDGQSGRLASPSRALAGRATTSSSSAMKNADIISLSTTLTPMQWKAKADRERSGRPCVRSP